MTSGQICGRFGENENVFCSGVKYWSFAQTWQPILYNVIYGAIAPLYTLIVILRIANSENIRKLDSFPEILLLIQRS